MDLQWINSLVLPLLLLIGTMAAFIMVLMLLIDTISFYRRRLKRNPPEASSSPAPARDGSQKANPVQAGSGEGRAGVEESGGVLDAGQTPAQRKKITRILARFMIFRSRKSKKESMKLAPPPAPILPESPAGTSPITSVQQPATTEAAVADSAANGQSTVSSETPSTMKKSDRSPPQTRVPSEPAERSAPFDGSPPASGSKVEDQYATEADKKPPEGTPEEKEGGDDAPKIKLKPLASLEEARKIIEAKAASKATESKAQPVVETDDVASLLGIATPIEEKARAPNQVSDTVSKSAPATSDNKASIADTAAEVPEVISNQKSSANSSGENIAASKPKGDYGEEELTAAEILMMNSREDEILVLSKQLSELKSSLVQLEKKLKSLKEK